jgi:hypothetical protein
MSLLIWGIKFGTANLTEQLQVPAQALLVKFISYNRKVVSSNGSGHVVKCEVMQPNKFSAAFIYFLLFFVLSGD